ncbi:MAG: hypothetical protein AAF438_19960 [Pseudomonadota bacterium]
MNTRQGARRIQTWLPQALFFQVVDFYYIPLDWRLDMPIKNTLFLHNEWLD